MVSLTRKNRYLPMGRWFSFLSVSLVFTAWTATLFAEDAQQGVCQASNSLSVLLRDKNVIAYAPKGAWAWPALNVSVVNIEGNSITPTSIPTPNPVNACASNSKTGETICTANNTDVYVIAGTTLKSKLTSGGSGAAVFLEGNCTNCGITMDSTHNRAVLGLSLNTPTPVAGFQILNLGSSPTFEKAFASQAPNTDGSGAGQISAGILIDPIRGLILSPNAHSNFEIIKLPPVDGDDAKQGEADKDDQKSGKTAVPTLFENVFQGFQMFSSAGEDCASGIALATLQDDPSDVYIADLNRAKAIPGSPAGTWTAPSQIQTLTESHLSNGANGIAIAQGTHIGILTGEFGAGDPNGGNITAIVLGKEDADQGDSKGSEKADGPPNISDWVTCSIPAGFSTGLDPHAVAAYKSPKGDHAIGVVGNWDPVKMAVTTIAVIDLTKMLDKEIVPRTKGSGLGHACASRTLQTTGSDAVVSFVSVP